MKMKIKVSMLVIISVVFPPAAYASAPAFMPLQGFIEEADGTPISGDINIHFAIYDAELGGTALWYETQNILVEEGVFAVYLGEVEAIDLSIFRDNTNLWLAVQVEADPEMDRVYLGSTPFTGYAEYCGNIPDHGHDFSQIEGTLPEGALPAGVAVGAQSCTGTDKVVGIDMWGDIVCSADDDTTYMAGAGLLLAGNVFSADMTALQARVTGTCTPGSSIRVINGDGTVSCEMDDDTTYSAGTGITLTGTTFSVDGSLVQSRVAGVCAPGSSIREINIDGSVVCEPDDDSTGGWADDGAVVRLVDSTDRVGIGTTNPGAKLDVVGGDIRLNDSDFAYRFKSDPGGGSGDAASIRYYPESGENTKLLISVQNDPDDDIELSASGGVKVGCRSGFWSVGDGRLCMESVLRGPNNMWNAIGVCKGVAPSCRVTLSRFA